MIRHGSFCHMVPLYHLEHLMQELFTWQWAQMTVNSPPPLLNTLQVSLVTTTFSN